MKTKIKVADFFKEWTGTRPNLKVEFHEAGIEAMAFAEAYHNAESKANGVDESTSTCNLQNVSGSNFCKNCGKRIEKEFRFCSGLCKEIYYR